MSFLFRATSVLNVGATVTFRTTQSCRTTLKCAYSKSAFGVGKIVKLDTYESRRQNATDKLQSASEQLRLRIINGLDALNAINSRDIQELIFTARKEDLELVIASLKKLELQSERMRFSTFNMDAVVMRMFAYLKLPEEAYKTFLDEDFKKMFVGFNCIVILLDLLYRNGKYQYILECVDCLEKRQNFNVWSSCGVGSFYITSCIKIRTPEAFKKGLLHYDKVLRYREAVPELTLLVTIIALYTNPQKVEHYLKLLGNKPRYRSFQMNAIVQSLIGAGKLLDVEEYLKINKCELTRDTYDLILTLSKEETGNADGLDKIIKDFKVLDVSLEEWVIQENNKEPEERSSNFNKVRSRKGHKNY